MEWDQRAFAWLYRTFRRATGTERGEDAESPLDSLTPRFEMLGCLLTGNKWEVAGARGIGGVAPGRLLLPHSVLWLREPDDQASFYLYRVVFGVTASELGFRAIDGWSDHRRALAMLLSVPATQEVITGRYPGAASLLERSASIFKASFPFNERGPGARCFSIACRLVLGQRDAGAEDGSEVATKACELADAALKYRTMQDVRDASGYFERVLGCFPRRRREETYLSPWGLLMTPPLSNASILEPPDEPQDTLPSGTERSMGRRPTDVEQVDIDSQKNRENPLVHSFEKVHTATEYESGRKQLDGSDQLAEHEEALKELDLRKVTRSSEAAKSIYRAELQGGLDSADVADEPETVLAHHYPEWNFRDHHYRDAWCTVNEVSSIPRAPALVVASASRRLHGEVLRLQAELKRLEFERRWRNRQLDGTEVDIDALVDRQAILMARRHPDPRIYVRRKLHDAELAMLVLVDASLSSDSWVSNRRIFDVVRDSAQVLVESFQPTSAKLSLAAFYSNTRRDCRFVMAKRFDDTVATGLRRLHTIKPAGYTRIGPVIRHATKLLEDSGARRRLMVLLTDAKPTDYDRYEGRYGIEDVRQSIREAHEEQVRCLTLAVRDSGQAYLSQAFGLHGWTLLRDVQSLPPSFVTAASEFLRN